MYRYNRPPATAITLSLPQRSYLPHDALRANLFYPARDGIDDVIILKAAIAQVGLAHLARALIARPQLLYLDEATNQLDDAAARELIQTLQAALPDTFCLAISHQPPINALFPHHIDPNRYRPVTRTIATGKSGGDFVCPHRMKSAAEEGRGGGSKHTAQRRCSK